MTAIAASASSPPRQSRQHRRKHPVLPALSDTPTPSLGSLSSSNRVSYKPAARHSHPGLVYPAASLLPPLGRAYHHNSPRLSSSSPPSACRRASREKAGKLSLFSAQVCVGWAGGLPLALWRMILWMKTEEMALGELLERLRTVTQSIGW